MEASAARITPAVVRVGDAKPNGHGRNPDRTHAGPPPLAPDKEEVPGSNPGSPTTRISCGGAGFGVDAAFGSAASEPFRRLVCRYLPFRCLAWGGLTTSLVALSPGLAY